MDGTFGDPLAQPSFVHMLKFKFRRMIELYKLPVSAERKAKDIDTRLREFVTEFV
jgi:hypothetical protein